MEVLYKKAPLFIGRQSKKQIFLANHLVVVIHFHLILPFILKSFSTHQQVLFKLKLFASQRYYYNNKILFPLSIIVSFIVLLFYFNFQSLLSLLQSLNSKILSYFHIIGFFIIILLFYFNFNFQSLLFLLQLFNNHLLSSFHIFIMLGLEMV